MGEGRQKVIGFLEGVGNAVIGGVLESDQREFGGASGEQVADRLDDSLESGFKREEGLNRGIVCGNGDAGTDELEDDPRAVDQEDRVGRACQFRTRETPAVCSI